MIFHCSQGNFHILCVQDTFSGQTFFRESLIFYSSDRLLKDCVIFRSQRSSYKKSTFYFKFSLFTTLEIISILETESVGKGGRKHAEEALQHSFSSAGIVFHSGGHSADCRFGAVYVQSCQ